MAADTPTKAKPGGKKGGGLDMKKKLGPLPVYGWLIAAVGAFLVYHFIAGRATSGTTPAADTSGAMTAGSNPGSSGGAAGGASGPAGDASGGGFDAYASLASTLLAQTQASTDAFTKALAGGTSSAPSVTNNYYTTPATATSSSAESPPPPAPPSSAQKASPTAIGSSGAPYTLIPTPETPSQITLPTGTGTGSIGGLIVDSLAYAQGLASPQKPVPASSPSFAYQASGKTAGAAAAQVPVAFGGVVSVKTLANGSTLTTYASGRQVQQVPGKSAYVVKA